MHDPDFHPHHPLAATRQKHGCPRSAACAHSARKYPTDIINNGSIATRHPRYSWAPSSATRLSSLQAPEAQVQRGTALPFLRAWRVRLLLLPDFETSEAQTEAAEDLDYSARRCCFHLQRHRQQRASATDFGTKHYNTSPFYPGRENRRKFWHRLCTAAGSSVGCRACSLEGAGSGVELGPAPSASSIREERRLDNFTGRLATSL